MGRFPGHFSPNHLCMPQRCANQSNLSVASTVPHPSNSSDIWILPCLSTPSLVPPRGSDMKCHASAAYSLKVWMALRLLTFPAFCRIYFPVCRSTRISLSWHGLRTGLTGFSFTMFSVLPLLPSSLSTALYTPFPSCFFSISSSPFSFPLD